MSPRTSILALGLPSKIIMFLFAFVVGIAVTTLLAKPAHALDSCSVFGDVCFYQDINYSGNQYVFYLPSYNTCYNLPPSWNDQASSVYNAYPNTTLYVYWDANCNNISLPISGDSGIADLRTKCVAWGGGHCTVTWNDKISSWKRI